MSNINFVPDDYVQSTESRRANLMCLVLFSVVMAALGGTFVTIKIRQRHCSAQESLVNAKMVQMQDAIQKFEELQAKRKEMMKTALTTAELLEPVPRSVLLASLTNNLPTGTSLVKLSMVQKDPDDGRGTRRRTTNSSKYTQNAGQTGSPGSDSKLSPEQRLETHMDIEGMAPSDLQVSDYMQRLGDSLLLDNVALVESVEKKVDDVSFRHFKLKAMLSRQVHLTKEDIDGIRTMAENSIYNF